MKKKIYISLPIAGQESTVFERAQNAEDYLVSCGYEAVNPLKENGQHKGNIDKHCEKENIAKYLSNDIYNLAHCDGIYMCKGWQNSKGCNVELEFAKQYGLNIQYELWYTKN